MFFAVKTIALGELKSLMRQKTFTLLLVIFLFMASFSAYIGWSTKNTILKVYDETVKEMVGAGIKEIPANPFLTTPPLSILKNMVVYVFLIGSLLAIIVGYSAFIRERRAGVAKIIFSRRASRPEFILGKISGIFLALSLILAASFGLSYFSVFLIFAHPLSGSETVKLLLFYGASLIYLFIFSLLGLFFAVSSHSESTALLVPMVIWILTSFVMPQLTTALDPTALLNPTNLQTTLPQNNFFITLQSIINPFSIAEDYKQIGRSLLAGDTSSYPFLSILAYLIVLGAGCFYKMGKFNVCEPEIDQ